MNTKQWRKNENTTWGKNCQMSDTYERFHIYKISKQNIQLNDNFAEIYNTSTT